VDGLTPATDLVVMRFKSTEEPAKKIFTRKKRIMKDEETYDSVTGSFTVISRTGSG